MKASLTWDGAVGAYRLNFTDIRWRTDRPMFMVMIGALKQSIPISDRDYDDATYTWYIHEKHVDKVKLIVRSNVSEFNFVEKPVDQPFQTNFYPVEQDLASLSKIFGQPEASLKAMSFNEVKKLYRRKAMELHPDRNGGDGEAMCQLNEIWTRVMPKIWKEQIPV